MDNEVEIKRRKEQVITSWSEERLKKNKNTFNRVLVRGKIEKEFEYEHSSHFENFFFNRIIVTRTSGVNDFIPLIISEFLLEKGFEKKSFEGKFIEVVGQFRSFNKHDKKTGKSSLQLYLFATGVNIYDDESKMNKVSNVNISYLEGYICKPPVYRTTPLGRQITDFVIAVNRSYGKSDYIPCIAWGKIAKSARDLQVGDRIKVYGRIQSREYFKRYSPDSELGEKKVAYEISTTRFQLDLKIEEN